MKMGEDGKTFLYNFPYMEKKFEWLALWGASSFCRFDVQEKWEMYAILDSYVWFGSCMKIF